jgi:hypothetical protein
MDNDVAGSNARVARQFWLSALRIGSKIALIRISVLWYLTYREWTGTQSLCDVFLIYFLLPEGFILPNKWSWTAAHVWLFTGTLFISSFIVGMMLADLMRAAQEFNRTRR